MHTLRRTLPAGWIVFAALFSCSLFSAAQSAPAILHAAEASKLLPDSVYYAGKSAGTQLRNSAGIQFPGNHYTLAVLVDTSGYSTAVAQKYQGYLLTEVPLEFGGHRLPPGAYGFGFVSGHFGVMDIGNHDLLQAPTTHDQQMKRPVPLQILDAASGSYRLCSGRDCVVFQSAQ